MSELSQWQIDDMSKEAMRDVKAIIEKLEKKAPGVTKGLAEFIKARTDSSVPIEVLSSAGISAGVAAAAGVAGAAAVVAAGLGALIAAPAVLLGAVGYAAMSASKKAQLVPVLNEAISNLLDVRMKLSEYDGCFKNEITIIKSATEFLKAKKNGK